MSKLRSVNTHFWDDNYTSQLDPIEKLLFLYLLTNPLTNMLGIYELPMRRIAFDTGIDRDMVAKVFERFKRDGKADYVEGFVILKNFLRNQKLNTNMQTSAITSYRELPEIIKEHEFTRYALKGSEWFGSLSNGSESRSRKGIGIEGEIENENEGEKRTIPTLPDCIQFFKQNEGTEQSANAFFLHFDSQGWVKTNGRPISVWQSAAKKWIDTELHNPTKHNKPITERFAGGL